MSDLHSIEAEASVIGTAMVDGDQIPALAGTLRPDDFYDQHHRMIWSGILNVARDGQPCDIVTMHEHFQATGQADELGGIGALAEMSRNVPATANAGIYAEIVADMAQRRRIAGALPYAASEASDRETPADEIITRIQGQLESMRRARPSQLLRAGEYLGDEFINPLDARWSGEQSAMGVPYGLKDLDDMTLGMKKGDLVVVGARPSMGKTGFMMNCLRPALESGIPVLVESLEMQRPALFNRLVAGIADIPIAALHDPHSHQDRMDEYFSRIPLPVTQIRDADLYVNHDTPRTISQIRAQVQEIHERHGHVGLVMIDYLGKIQVEGDYGSRHDREIGEVVTGAKQIAKDFDCPVVLLSQLNRGVEQRTNKRPMMSDLKDSSAIEQEADTILFLYRDEVYNPDNPDSKGLAEIIIAKQREGSVGTVHCVSRLSHARFENLAPKSITAISAGAQHNDDPFD